MKAWTWRLGWTGWGTSPIEVNLIYSHSGDEAQMAASEAIERRLEAARDTLEKRRQAGFQALSPLLTVTQTVTPNRSREATHWKHGRPGEIRTPDPRFRKTPFGQLSTFKLLNLRAVTGLGLGGNRPL